MNATEVSPVGFLSDQLTAHTGRPRSNESMVNLPYRGDSPYGLASKYLGHFAN